MSHILDIKLHWIKKNKEKQNIRGVRTGHLTGRASDQSQRPLIAGILTHPDIGEGQKNFTTFSTIE
jgi:hypothetical protein